MILHEDAVCKSWGCHSGELYSKWWKNEFDVAMTGAVGKTDFSHGGLPALSDAELQVDAVMRTSVPGRSFSGAHAAPRRLARCSACAAGGRHVASPHRPLRRR